MDDWIWKLFVFLCQARLRLVASGSDVVAIEFFCAFVDFKGAFDSVDRSLLLRKLKQNTCIDRSTINMITVLLSNVTASVKGCSEYFYENISDLHFNLFHTSRHYYNNQDINGLSGLDSEAVKKYLLICKRGNPIKSFLEKNNYYL